MRLLDIREHRQCSLMAVQIIPAKRPSKITIPEHCHPLAKLVFAEMKRQRIGYDALEWDSGVLRSTFKAWRTDNRPGLASIEAALGALGWALVPVPRVQTLPQEIRSELDALAARWGELDPLLTGLLSSVCKPPPFATSDRPAPNPVPPRGRPQTDKPLELAA